MKWHENDDYLPKEHAFDRENAGCRNMDIWEHYNVCVCVCVCAISLFETYQETYLQILRNLLFVDNNNKDIPIICEIKWENENCSDTSSNCIQRCVVSIRKFMYG